MSLVSLVLVDASQKPCQPEAGTTPYLPRSPQTDLTIDIPPSHLQLRTRAALHITIHRPTEAMATKQATVASFIESAPPGEVGRNGLPK